MVLLYGCHTMVAEDFAENSRNQNSDFFSIKY